jgi:hypothetical protein
MAWLLSAPFFMSACSPKVIGIAFERNGIKLTKINLQILHARFNLAGEELAFSKASGLEDGSFFRNMFEVASEALLANGISLSDKSDAEYTITMQPSQYKVTTRLPVGTKFRTVELKATLLRNGQPQPLWTGTRSFDLSATKRKFQTPSDLQTDSNRLKYGNWVLGTLNGMQSDNVISLPNGYAVTPKGSRNYVSE